jgi:hypothetical protein
MKDHDAAFSPPSVEASKDPDDTLVLKIKGRLDAYSTGKIWKDSSYELEKSTPRKLIIDGEGIDTGRFGHSAYRAKAIQEKKGGSS